MSFDSWAQIEKHFEGQYILLKMLKSIIEMHSEKVFNSFNKLKKSYLSCCVFWALELLSSYNVAGLNISALF